MVAVPKLKNLIKTPPLWPLLTYDSPKVNILNFEEEEKLDLYVQVKFDKESELKVLSRKISRDPLIDPIF